MKKFCWILLFAILFSGLSAYACFHKKTADKKIDFEIIPTMNTVSNAKNTVWVGTFQLIWNDLIDEIVKAPVEFVGEKSVMADNLNKKDFTINELNENSYYKKLGLASPELKKEIETAIKEKFNEKSDILGRLNWTPAKGKYVLYAMLKKDFEYVKPFDELADAEFTGSHGKVKYFGISDESPNQLRYTVRVLFYNNKDDFALALKSKQGDNVFLYRTNDDKTLEKLYNDMQKKTDSFMGIRTFGKKDQFKAPVIDFKKEKDFTELCNKRIKNSDYMISKAIETVQFKMNRTGVKLKSEAAMIVALTCAPNFREDPRYFYFDNKYVIFMQEGNSKPYFGLKVEDAKALQ